MKKSAESGQVLIYALGVVALLVIMIAAILSIAGGTYLGAKRSTQVAQAGHLAEAGLDWGVERLRTDPNWTGAADVGLGNGTFSMTVADVVPGNPLRKEIRATAWVPRQAAGAASQTRSIIVAGSAGGSETELSFSFAAQIGDGGIRLENGASISGNVFSNGEIYGDRNNAISGHVTVAGPTGTVRNFRELGIAGNVTAHFMRRLIVAGNATGYECRDSIISGNLYAPNRTRCTVTGSWIRSPVPTDPAPRPFPIPQATIDQWKADAEAGGTQGSLTLANGGETRLGPRKIAGDLRLDNNSILTLTGVVWVTGQVRMDNRAVVRLDPALYGTNDGLLISDGLMHITNNADIQGSGAASSATMLLVLSNGADGHHDSALDFHNNVTAAVVYVPNGIVHLHNNVRLKSITAYRLYLKENARLTYDAGLALLNIVTNPGAGGGTWQVEPGTWQIIRP